MPIAFDLEKVRKDHNCSIYFETGLWDPSDDISSKQALNSGFDKVYCIEIRKDWVESGNKIFEKEIVDNRYKLILDDSANMKNHFDKHILKNKVMFFLDAHVDNENIHNYKTRCPLFFELEAIKSLGRNDNIILVDDLRIITRPFPWNESSYGNIDFLDSIKKKILEINKDYRFSTLDGHVPNDVLIAYL